MSEQPFTLDLWESPSLGALTSRMTPSTLSPPCRSVVGFACLHTLGRVMAQTHSHLIVCGLHLCFTRWFGPLCVLSRRALRPSQRASLRMPTTDHRWSRLRAVSCRRGRLMPRPRGAPGAVEMHFPIGAGCVGCRFDNGEKIRHAHIFH